MSTFGDQPAFPQPVHVDQDGQMHPASAWIGQGGLTIRQYAIIQIYAAAMAYGIGREDAFRSEGETRAYAQDAVRKSDLLLGMMERGEI